MTAVRQLRRTRGRCRQHEWPAESAAVLRARLRVAVTPLWHPERPARLSAYGTALLVRARCTGSGTDLARSLAVHRKAVRVAAGHPDLGLCLTNLTLALASWSDGGAEAVDTARQAAALPAARATRAERLYNLTEALLSRYEEVGDTDVLAEAATVLQAVVPLTEPGARAALVGLLNALAEELRDDASVEAALDAARDELSHVPADHPSRPDVLAALAGALHLRYEEEEDLADLDEAVAAYREALALQGPESDPTGVIASNLSLVLRVRHDRTRSPEDLEEALALARLGVERAATDGAARAERMARLTTALHSAYDHTGDVSVLSEAVEVGRFAVAAVPAGHVDRRNHLSNLANVLALAAYETSDGVLADEAVRRAREALALTPAGHPHHVARQITLASLLRSRWARCSDRTALDEARQLLAAVIAATAAGRNGTGAGRRVWGDLQLADYEVLGDREVLADAIDQLRQLMPALPEDHPDRVTALASLADALSLWYSSTGELAALDEAIAAAREALALLPAGHPQRAYLRVVLGNALAERSERPDRDGSGTGPGAGAEAVIQLRAAAGAGSWVVQADLAAALHRLWLGTGSVDADLVAEAVAVARTAVERCPPDDPDRGMALSNLAAVLPAADVEEAIGLTAEAVEVAGADSPSRGFYLANLGNLHRSRWRRERDDVASRQAAMAAYCAAAEQESAPTHVRVDTARAWAELAGDDGDWATATDAFRLAVGLLPRLAARWLGRADQEHLLARMSGLAADAAACAVRAGDASIALDLAERARGVLLAHELRDWPRPASRDRRESPEPVPGLPLARSTQTPTGAPAGVGTVVVVNSSRFGSHALLVAESTVRALPLPLLDPDVVRAQVQAFLAALDDVEDADSPAIAVAVQKAASDVLGRTLGWLWDVVAEPVLGELGHTAEPPPGAAWPRVWWSPTGLMSFLPVHAAGRAGSPDATGRPVGGAVLDRVVSSYTPTLRALLHARRGAGDRPPGPAMLVVSVSDAEAGAAADAHALEASYPGRVRVLAGAAASRDAVLQALPAHGWVHFACHGVIELEDPSSARLLLAEGDRTPLRLRDVEQLRLPAAEFAFLAACDTSGVSRLPNEAIQLTAAFFLAGYRGVAGTWWAVSDRNASRLAGDFYAHALASGEADLDACAEALHHAVRSLRDRWRQYPSVWAGYIHVGR